MSEHDGELSGASWPLDTPTHVLDALAEQGISPDEAARLSPSLLRLSAWQAPLSTAAQRDQLLARLTSQMQASTLAMPSPTIYRPVRCQLASLARVFIAQARLLRPVVWIASAVAIILAALYALTLPRAMGEQNVLVFALPLIAATGVAFLYGPEVDAGLELALATPTSPRIVLLSRFALLFSFDTTLAFVAVLLVGARGPGVWTLMLAWLGPMALLSALSLALSVFLGPASAAGGATALWLSRIAHFDGGVSLWLAPSLVWPSTPLALALALGVLIVVIYLAPRSERLSIQEH